MLEIIPVLDLMSGIAVSGKSGQRDTYQPLKSVYSSSPNPVEIAHSLKQQGARQIYIADLDALEKKGSNLEIVKSINHLLPVMLDCGVRDLNSFEFALNFAQKIIIGTETLESLDNLYKIFEKYPSERIVVSVDIKNGELFSNSLDMFLEEFRDNLLDLNPSEIILLDISQVGTEKGFNKKLIDKFSTIKESLILGGGITPEEIPDIDSEGIKKVLIGSALHKGSVRLFG
jgi:phosphoribosylformimino-5-aminoimidazole carboxamide ribotide isomerase